MTAYYVVRGAKMKCDKGSNVRKINLPVSHGSYVKGKPILIETDSTLDNISYFGVCQNVDRLPEQVEIDVINEKGELQHGKKCIPSFGAKWENAKGDTIIEGKAALTNESKIFCNCGGVITFVSHGQE